MKKTLFLFLFCCLLTLPRAKAISVKVAASEPNGLVQFLMGCERHNETNALYKMLKESQYYTEQTRDMLQQWAEVEKYSMLNFEGFPENRHNGRTVSDLIMIQSVKAKNATDLAQSCMGYFTQTELKKFKAALLYFEPIYRQLVWQPHLKKINAKLKEVQAYVKQKNIATLFNQAAVFYGTKWEDDFPFYIMINPLPGRVQYTTAGPMGYVLVADLVLDEKDLNGWFGVVFHEMCHVLFNSQGREKQEQLDRFFTTSLWVNDRLPAYNWFNETMATALGNGWVVEKITGQLDSSAWYNNNYIDQFARAVYTLVKTYVEAGKTIDRDFVEGCVARFKEKFATINTQTEHLFTFVDLVADSMPQQSYNELFKHFYPRSLGCQTPLNDSNLEKVNAGVNTKAAVIVSDKAEQLKKIGKQWDLTFTPQEKSCVYYFLEKDGKNYFVFALNSLNDFGKAIALIAAKKNMEENAGMILVE